MNARTPTVTDITHHIGGARNAGTSARAQDVTNPATGAVTGGSHSAVTAATLTPASNTIPNETRMLKLPRRDACCVVAATVKPGARRVKVAPASTLYLSAGLA